LNKIILQAAQFEDLLKWRDANKELLRKFIPALLDGEIIIGGNGYYSSTEFHIHGDISQGYITDITFSYWTQGKGLIKIVSYEMITGTKNAPAGASLMIITQIHNDELYEATGRMLWRDPEVRDLNADAEEAMKQDICTTLSSVNAYLFHYRSDWDDVETREVKRNLVQRKGKFKYSNKQTVIIGRRYTLKGQVRQDRIPKYKQRLTLTAYRQSP